MDWKYSVNIQWDIHRMDTGQWSCDLLSHFLWHHPLLALRRVTVSSHHLAVLIRLVQKQRRIMRERWTKNVEKYGLLSSPLPRYGLFPRTFAPHFCFGNKTTNLILLFPRILAPRAYLIFVVFLHRYKLWLNLIYAKARKSRQNRFYNKTAKSCVELH